MRGWTIELEQRVAERTHELLHSRTRLRALASELTLTEQRERQRLASELHDYLAQLLVFGRMKLSQAKRGNLGPATKVVQELDEMLDEALTYTRSLVAQLSPPVLREFGLVVAIRWLAEQMRRQEMTVAVHCDLELAQMQEDQAVLLFQSARELLINVSKHAGTARGFDLGLDRRRACCISVSPMKAGDSIRSSHRRISQRPCSVSSASGNGWMRLGGRMTVESSPGLGTKITLVIPYSEGPREGLSRMKPWKKASSRRASRSFHRPPPRAGISPQASARGPLVLPERACCWWTTMPCFAKVFERCWKAMRISKWWEKPPMVNRRSLLATVPAA